MRVVVGLGGGVRVSERKRERERDALKREEREGGERNVYYIILRS